MAALGPSLGGGLNRQRRRHGGNQAEDEAWWLVGGGRNYGNQHAKEEAQLSIKGGGTTSEQSRHAKEEVWLSIQVEEARWPIEGGGGRTHDAPQAEGGAATTDMQRRRCRDEKRKAAR